MKKKEAAVKCWFTVAGIPMPLMFKVIEDDDILTVNKLEVLNTKRERELGRVIWKFKVKAVVNDRVMEFKMEFNTVTCKWVLSIETSHG